MAESYPSYKDRLMACEEQNAHLTEKEIAYLIRKLQPDLGAFLENAIDRRDLLARLCIIICDNREHQR